MNVKRQNVFKQVSLAYAQYCEANLKEKNVFIDFPESVCIPICLLG